MIKAIIGKKVGMTQVFLEDGTRVPVTVVKAGPCCVVQNKTIENDGYSAVQLGFEQISASGVSKPYLGHCTKSGSGVFRYLKEFRTKSNDALSLGETVTLDVFDVNDLVDVTGISIGKGFQGVIKRWNFKGGRASHGSRFHRAPGSIGASATPSHVFKNKKMPGQMGNEKVTIQRLKIIRKDLAGNLLLIKGAIPGCKNSIVMIKKSVKA